MTVIGIREAKDIIRRISMIMIEKKKYLIELDSFVGDGDLGITMEKAFSAADALKFNEEELPGRYFMQAGLAMAKAAPSTMGTLVATGFMRGGKAVKDKEQLLSDDLYNFFKAFMDGIMERGKTKPGEKTIVDVLDHIVKVLKENTDKSLAESLSAGLVAAEDGLEATKNMMAQHGKAAVFREKTIGLPDQGGVACLYIMQGFKEAIIN